MFSTRYFFAPLAVVLLLVGARPLAAQSLTWDEKVKEVQTKAGETNAQFVFTVTNETPKGIAIMSIRASCGCTTVKAPTLPWILQPGTGGQLEASVDLRGKSGLLAKSIILETSAGPQVLLTRVNISSEFDVGSPLRARMNNLVVAQANRQAVFKGDCARCHVAPAKEKTGRSLYLAACGICHDAEHRATMVPDLHQLKHPTDRAFWRVWIAQGKAGTLMPAFAESEGGPLTKEQIDSLVDLLEKEIPSPIPARDGGK